MVSSLIPILSVLLCTLYANAAFAQRGPTSWTTTPFNPFCLPLAVRNPYLNTWFAQGNDPPMLGKEWASFWTNKNIDWFVAIVVDGQAYQLSGGATTVPALNGSVNQKSVSFTPTGTTFNMQTGPMDVNLTFLSPVEPKDLVRQSMPFSYLYITTESNDGNAHNVRLYSDVTGKFLQDASSANISWTHRDDGTNIILSERLVQSLAFTEIDNHAADAIEYYCYKKINGTKTLWQISSNTTTKNAATNMNTSLNNTADAGQAPLNDSTVLAVQIDFGEIQATPEPAVFTVGLVREPAIQYMLPNGTIQTRSHYYRSSFDTDVEALTFFMEDFKRAHQAAESFDSELLRAGSTISSSYADLLALTTRQVFGSLDITLSHGSDGNWNFSDAMVFMKNMGAAGSDSPTSNRWTNSVNTVDTLFTAFPAFLYLNPEIAGYLLAPLLKYQDSTAYTQPYAAKNIGTVYPNATADSVNQPHPFGIEESANMLIMTLAYTQASGNKTLINNHYGLLKGWCNYLVNNTLTPSDQRWADYSIMKNNLPVNNQTNLALKGIIAIAAMSRIASLTGNDNDASQYNGTSTSYIQTWQEHALTSSNINYFYDDTITAGLLYDIFADVMLGLEFVPTEVYTALTKYYSNFIGRGGDGIPLMSQIPDLTSVSAMMLSAAAVAENATRNAMIAQVRSYASSNLNNSVLGGYYNPLQGSIIEQPGSFSGHGLNSPTMGSIFAILLDGPVTQASTKIGSIPNTILARRSSTNVGAIVGGIIGGSLSVIGGILLFLRRRSRRLLIGQENRNGWSSQSRFQEMFTVYPFPFSTTNPMVQRFKSRNDIPRAQVTTGIDRKTTHQAEADRNERIPDPQALTGAELLTRPENSASMLQRGDNVQTDPPVAALETVILNQDRTLQDEVENLRREVEMMRLRAEINSEISPPTYRE